MWPLFPELLEHERGAAELEPAPAQFAVVDPLLGHGESEAVDVEARGARHVVDGKERHGLLDVHATRVYPERSEGSGAHWRGAHRCKLTPRRWPAPLAGCTRRPCCAWSQ